MNLCIPLIYQIPSLPLENSKLNYKGARLRGKRNTNAIEMLTYIKYVLFTF